MQSEYSLAYSLQHHCTVSLVQSSLPFLSSFIQIQFEIINLLEAF